jgi:uncharacterized integral membrane protein
VSTPQNPPTGPQKSPWTARRIILGAIVLYAVVVVIANSRHVTVNLLVVTTGAPLFVVLLLTLGVGFLAGWLFDDVRDRRRRRRNDAG